MPELPEVETTRRGIAPHVEGRRVTDIIVREPRLRWPVPDLLTGRLKGQELLSVQRRGKYLLLNTRVGTVIMHLGMSGSLRIVNNAVEAGRHDHVDICLDSGQRLRYRDPRKFGAILWTGEPPAQHPLLINLGPEPLEPVFSGEYLYLKAAKRKLPVKQFIMDAHVVVGVGNIYANEALFEAGIDPRRAAGRIARSRYEKLVECVRTILLEAIRAGGTTLRDFVDSQGKPGYFKQVLSVYGRAGLPCERCQEPLREIRMAQRTTVFCGNCQR